MIVDIKELDLLTNKDLKEIIQMQQAYIKQLENELTNKRSMIVHDMDNRKNNNSRGFRPL